MIVVTLTKASTRRGGALAKASKIVDQMTEHQIEVSDE